MKTTMTFILSLMLTSVFLSPVQAENICDPVLWSKKFNELEKKLRQAAEKQKKQNEEIKKLKAKQAKLAKKTQPLYVGLTNRRYDGKEVEGWSGAKAKCSALYGNAAHMCTGSEMVASLQFGKFDRSKFQNVKVKYWVSSGNPGIYKSSKNKHFYNSSCYGWTSTKNSTIQGTVIRTAVTKAVYLDRETCSNKHKIACCK